jgi:hypothetical protein
VVAGGEPTRAVIEVLGTCAPPAATNEPLPGQSPQAGRSFLLRRTGAAEVTETVVPGDKCRSCGWR